MRNHKKFLSVITLLVIAVFLTTSADAMWDRKKYQFSVVGLDGEPLSTSIVELSVYRNSSMLSRYVYPDQTVTSNGAPYLTPGTNCVINFWSEQDSVDIYVRKQAWFDVFAGVTPNTHELVYEGRNLHIYASTPTAVISQSGFMCLLKTGGVVRLLVLSGHGGTTETVADQYSWLSVSFD